MKSHLTLLISFMLINSFLISSMYSIGPPTWPQRFTQDYMQGTTGGVYAPGKIWYDSINNRQRVDMKHITVDFECYYIAKTYDTSCTTVYVNQTLYIRLPDLNMCCKCCKQKLGSKCGMLSPDWLKDYQYVGETDLNGTIYNKWTHKGFSFYYATIGQKQIPGRTQDILQYTDYFVNSFSDAPIDEKIFYLPSQCQNACPYSLFCSGADEQLNYEKLIVEKTQNQNLVKEKIKKQE